MKINIKNNEREIVNLLYKVKRENIEEFIKSLQGCDFFEAPCSTKYHLNVKGGLAEHSLSVYKTLNKLCKQFNINLSDDTKILTSLLHDLCKIDLYKWDKEKEEWYKDDIFPIGHGEKSVIYIQRFINLTNQEISMIRWHMGMYESPFNKYSFSVQKYFPETMLLYFADHISTLFIEDSNVMDGEY